MKKILSIVLLAILIGPAANAASIDLGTIGIGDVVGEFQFVPGEGTAIDDDWTFTIEDEQGCCNVGIVFDSAELEPLFGIFVFTVSSPDITFVFDSVDNAWTSLGPLAPGTYTVDVSGVVSGALGGEYQVLVGATAVPVPAALWLLGSALALVSLRRRRT